MKYRFKAWGWKDKESGNLAMDDELTHPEIVKSRNWARATKKDTEKVVRLDVTIEVKECAG